MNIGEFISKTAERVGYNGEAVKELLANPALSQITLPEELESAIKENLITIKEARTNPLIKHHFTGSALNKLDEKLAGIADRLGLDEEFSSEIYSILEAKKQGDDSKKLNTYENLERFASMVEESIKKASVPVQGDKQKLVEENMRLKQENIALQEAKKAEVSNVNNNWVKKLMEKEINGHFKNYDYLSEYGDSEIAATAALLTFNKKLEEKGGKIVFNEEKGIVELVSNIDDSLPFTLDHKPVDFKTFADSVVGEAKMVKVRQPNPNPSPNPNPKPNPAFPTPTPVVAPAAKSQVSQALADLQGQK